MSIIIEGLNKIYPSGNHALKDVSLTIPSGMFGLLGPNGAGKSTLMRILVALMEPTSGKVSMFGYDLRTQKKDIRRILGYLPQDFRFFAKYKTYEFLDYAARLSGITNSRVRKQKVADMLEQVGLYEARDRFAARLSGGMKRRLGIAQALIHDPKIIIVDEPTTGLDPEERIKFRNILTNIAEHDVSIILSTHIVGDISSSCTHMTLMNRGQVSFFGSPEDLLKAAEGSVWLIHANDEEFHEIIEKYPVVATIPAEKGWDVQVVTRDIDPRYKAEAMVPNLEHAYVHFIDTTFNEWSNA
ncbi:MAG: ABC transporter ATP-binding protein [Bacteroidales bacterium]|nr:ABC transporter ATP-binding protein [Bacteroidales bacterium]